MDLGNILSAGVTEWIKELFARVFGDNAALATVLISIVPIIELKGAIPFGMSTAFWGRTRPVGRRGARMRHIGRADRRDPAFIFARAFGALAEKHETF